MLPFEWNTKSYMFRRPVANGATWHEDGMPFVAVPVVSSTTVAQLPWNPGAVLGSRAEFRGRRVGSPRSRIPTLRDVQLTVWPEVQRVHRVIGDRPRQPG